MKKLQKLLLLAFLSIGIYGTTYAQVPTPDATQTGVVADGNFTYSVPNVAGHSWTWEVLDNAGAAANGADYAMVDVSPVVGYSKNITWNTNGKFYVRVTSQHNTTLCTNDYVIEVNVVTNDYIVAFNTGTEKTYCADDANIGTGGMEIILDVTLNSGVPAPTYYDMEVQYKVDGGATQTATIGTDNKFNIPEITIADPVIPGFATVKVTIVQVKDKNGVIFNPLAANENLIITINPIPAKPTISF